MIDSTERFQRHRNTLFGIAYRMLGSVADAEDILQDTWLRWQQLPEHTIESPIAYLTRMVSRLCLDQLRSRKIRDRNYPGPWLPDPLPTEPSMDESANHATGGEPLQLLASLEDISIAFMLILEKLSPMERAVFILKEAFDFDHKEISSTLSIETPASRQLLSRAKRKLGAGRSKYQVEPERHRLLMTEFMTAIWQGDTASLKKLLTDDAVAYTDGGGVVTAARIPLEGPDRIIQVFSHIVKNSGENMQFHWLWLNGSWGVALYSPTEIIATITVAVTGDSIDRIYLTRNPKKLGHIDIPDLQAPPAR